MKLWYFAHPYSSPSKENHSENFALCNDRAVRLLDNGYLIFSPISHSHPLQHVKESTLDFWLKLDVEFMDRCDGLILAPGWEESEGCRFEYEYFKEKNKPILFYSEIFK